MIEFACINCGAPIKIEDAAAGRWGNCQTCNHRIQVPAQSKPVSVPMLAAATRHGSPANGRGSMNQVEFDPYLEWLQIPPERRPLNHYDLLGLTELESNPQQINDVGLSRIAAVRRYQVGPHSEQALRILNEMSAAYACLTSSERKKQYDVELIGILLDNADDLSFSGDEWGVEVKSVLDAAAADTAEPSSRAASDLLLQPLPENTWQVAAASSTPPRIEPPPLPNPVVPPEPGNPFEIVDTSQGMAAIALGMASLPFCALSSIAFLSILAVWTLAGTGLWLALRDFRTLSQRGGSGFGFAVAGLAICAASLSFGTLGAFVFHNLLTSGR